MAPATEAAKAAGETLQAPAAAAARADSAKPQQPTGFLPSSSLGIGHGGYPYWSYSPFRNTLHTGDRWIESAGGAWGKPVFFFTEAGERNPQFNQRGLPQYLREGTLLRLLLWPFHHGEEGAPFRAGTGVGLWTVSWQGDADIRLAGGTFVVGQSSGAATGALRDGRRVYQMDANNVEGHLQIHAINPAQPLTDLQVWLPDPAAPMERSLAGTEGRWHPMFLEMLGSLDLAFQRFMDWNYTNGSPQQDWEDRRLPDHIFQRGVLNRRSVGPNGPQDRLTGMAFEHMVDLANQTGNDMWICLPHLATDDFVRNLARLIRFGSDGRMPYTAAVDNPVYAPLRPDIRVWVEYSNEIWSNGASFPQGDWAAERAKELGIRKPEFNARRSVEIWRIFEEVFAAESDRMVRVGALWSGNMNYSESYMRELQRFGGAESPLVEPDVLAATTYFGNGIQDWAHAQAILHRHRDGAESWFYTPEDFLAKPRRGEMRPVSKPIADPYWQSPQFAAQLEAAILEWKQRLLSGAAVGGGGFDTTGIGGGFPAGLAQKIADIFGRAIPIVAYEGGPSLYTDYLDNGDPRSRGVTTFINQLNRLPGMEEVYRIHLNMARAKGLEAHGAFVDVGRWGRFGQWGHLEYLGQPPEDSPKWQTLVAWARDMQAVRTPTRAGGNAPKFLTSGQLPEAGFGASYRQVLEAAGDGAVALHVIGDTLCAGMHLAPDPENPARLVLEGTPTRTGWQYVYLRAQDAEGNAAWRVFGFEAVGGPQVLLDSSLAEKIDASRLPYSESRSLQVDRLTWSGLDIGAPYEPSGGTAGDEDGRGVQVHRSDAGLVFSVSQANEKQVDSTLASAIADEEDLRFTLLPKEGEVLDLRHAAITLIWERSQYHAPRAFSVFTSLSGWQEEDAVFSLEKPPATGVVTESRFLLPDTEDYAKVAKPLEIRIVFHGSQWGHQARILGLRIEAEEP